MAWYYDDAILERVERLELPWGRHGIDPYGIRQTDVALMMTVFGWMYHSYFDVEVHDIEHVPARGRAMLVGNHCGGVAIDGMMVSASCFFAMEPPRLAQGMVEKFMSRLPFAAKYSSRTGNFVGLPENAARLLEDERLLMVFPEGARGTAKLYKERNSLVRFGTGFVRLALQTRTPIIPVGFVGGGDALPTVANLYRLGKLVGMPYIPVTPWLVAVPRRAHLVIRYGEPVRLEGTGNEEDSVIHRHIEEIKSRIAALMEASGARVTQEAQP